MSPPTVIIGSSRVVTVELTVVVVPLIVRFPVTVRLDSAVTSPPMSKVPRISVLPLSVSTVNLFAADAF